VCSSDLEEKTLSVLVMALKQYSWDVAWLSDLKPDTETVTHLETVLRKANYYYMVRKHTPCPYINLPQLYDDYIKSLSKSIRLNSNNYNNKLSGVGKVAVESISQVRNVAEGMDYFFSLHRQRWEMKSEGGALKNEHIQSFHHEAAAGLINYLRLSFLIVNGLRISVMYGYRYKDTDYNYLPGFDSNWSKYRPGTILLLKLIENAISAGVRCFDFMRGNEEYKYHFTGTHRCNRVYYFAKSILPWHVFRLIEGLR
jgi:CelD/BcsL family acetyltransferase involved in cellulose biosynthesis